VAEVLIIIGALGASTIFDTLRPPMVGRLSFQRIPGSAFGGNWFIIMYVVILLSPFHRNVYGSFLTPPCPTAFRKTIHWPVEEALAEKF
jgi:hypothetical protein